MTRAATLAGTPAAIAPGKFFPRDAETSTNLKISALTRNPETIRCIRTLMQQENFANQWHLWMGESSQVAALIEQEHPQVLLLEDDGLIDPVLDGLSEIVERSPDLNVILISARQTPEFLLRAFRAGVREVTPLPLSLAALRDSMDGIHQRLAAGPGTRPPGRIMAWIASKGGAGATFVATNLAAAIAATGQRVCFIDLNVGFGAAARYVSELRPEKTVAEVLQHGPRLDGALLESSMLRVAPGFWLLPAADSPEAMAGIPLRSIASLLDAARAHFDVVLVDIHRAFDAQTVSVLEKADEIHLVLQMTLPFVRNTTRLLRLLAALGHAKERIKLLVNRFEKKGDIGLEQLAQTLGVSRPRTLPNSYAAVTLSINQGRPIIELVPHDPVARALMEFAHARGENAAPGPNWLQRIFKRPR